MKLRILVVMLLLPALTSCMLEQVAGVDDLNDWIQSQRKQAQAIAKIPPLIEIPERKIEVTKAEIDIFDPERAKRLAKAKNVTIDSKILQMYPLAGVPVEQLIYTGFFMQGNRRVALIRADQKIIRGHVGDKIGVRFGQITKISDSKIEFAEQIENELGKLTNHIGTIELTSGEKNAG